MTSKVHAIAKKGTATAKPWGQGCVTSGRAKENGGKFHTFCEEEKAELLLKIPLYHLNLPRNKT